MRQRFIDPLHRPSGGIRWVFLIAAVLLGAAWVRQSYDRAGIAQDWRISAGTAALAFALLGVLTWLFPPNEHQHWRDALVAVPIATVGAAGVALAQHQSSDWAEGLLLELGVSLLFLAAVDLLVESTVRLALESERRERQFYDELALAVAYSFDLSAFAYRAMREGLDANIALGRGRDEHSRLELLLEVARKAKDLPPHLDLPKRSDFRKGMAKEVRILELTLDAAARYGLTDVEHRYLGSVIATRADESFRGVDAIGINELPAVVDNSAALIVGSRHKGLFRFLDALAGVLDRDPLAARAELDARAGRLRGDDLGALVSDEVEDDELGS